MAAGQEQTARPGIGLADDDRHAVPATGLAARYDVQFDKPLEGFSTAGARAYSVTDKHNPQRPLYALVHLPSVPMRGDVYRSLRGAPATNLINPVDQGILAAPENGAERERLATILECPTGPPLFADGQRHPAVTIQVIRRLVVDGTAKALAALHSRDLTHRYIRPERLYFGSAETPEVIIGECFSAPPGSDGTDAFEPLERAAADPAARGAADPAADVYALGATLMSLYINERVGEGRDRQSLFNARVAQGSFWALSGGREIPGAMGVVLRGLLHDDPTERWTLEELMQWAHGALPQKRTGMQNWSLGRPVAFAGGSYADRRMLASAFARQPAEAAKFLRGLEFAQWVQIVLNGELFSDRLEKLLDVRPGEDLTTTRKTDHAMVARVCMHLDPTGPIRYRGLSLAIDGLGDSLADAFAKADQDRLTILFDLLGSNLLAVLLEIASESERNSTAVKLLSTARRIEDLVKGRRLGLGLERALYDLNPSLPCQSPKFERYWCGTSEAVIRTLDATVRSAKAANIFDRHVAAFIACQGGMADRAFNAIAANEHDIGRMTSAVMELLGNLQRTLRVGELPNLTGRLADGLRPLLNHLKSRRRRKQAMEQLDKLTGGGDITRLVQTLRVDRLLAQDAREFAQARAQFARVEHQRQLLKRRILPTNPAALLYGYRGVVLLGYGALVVTCLAVLTGA